MNCSACRFPVPDSATECPACGGRLPFSDDDGVTRLVAGAPEDGATRPPRAFSIPDSPGDDGDGFEGTIARNDSATVGSGRPIPASGDTGPLAPGQTLGPRYHIIKLIGLGGMGAVYQAWDAELSVVVALKVIRPEIAADPVAARDLERRFKREQLLARQGTHTNVVRIHDLGEREGMKYITMPFLEGEDLATILAREDRLPVGRALRIARTALSGLAAAHRAGVVHRDLKPANLMIAAGDDALIMDFGIARSTGEAPAASPPVPAPPGMRGAGSAGETSVGQIVGTVTYMAPEQARGEKVDQRADIYAFGLILYDMLLGPRRHSRGTTALDELQRRMTAPPSSPGSVDAAIPEALDGIVMRCLAPDPADRYQTSDELSAALDALDDEGQPRPKDRRLIHAVVASALLVVVAMFAANWWLIGPRKPAPPHEPVPVLIADFENKVGDPVFGGSLEQALGVALEEASFITSYNRADAGRVARRIQPGATLGPSVARLVAIREGVKVVLDGSIETDGGGYLLTLRAVNAADGKVAWAAKTRASDKSRVLPAVQTLAIDLRKTLGDTPRATGAESLTASSLEAVREYSLAQDLANAGRHADAIAHYRAAVERDPNFGRAYSGWATAAFYLGRKDEAEAEWKKAMALMGRMTEREKYRTLGTYYLGIARNYDKAIENYTALIKLYPTDLAGHNNLAFAYFSTLNFAKAREEGDKARGLYPKNVLIGNNAALYAMYAGDFASSANQARGLVEQQPGFFKNYLPLAVAALDAGQADAAADAYSRMAATGQVGASLASIGLADALLYEGRPEQAEAELTKGIAADEKAGSKDLEGVKWVALAEALEARGERSKALAAARHAIGASKDQATVVSAARVFAGLGSLEEARGLARELGSSLEPQPRAYAKIVEAEVAMASGQWADAVDALRAATRLADLWLVRFDLGVAYVRAGHEVEGLAELEACFKRRGEASAMFLDDTPTFRVLAPLQYWLGRAQEGAGQQAAASRSYQAFVRLRPEPSADPLAADARKRLR